MYLGRHCNINDYQLLERTSKEFLLVINRDNLDLKDLNSYLKIFSNFDFDISSKIRMCLEKLSTEKDKYLSKITNLLDELKNNVLVDIREHN